MPTQMARETERRRRIWEKGAEGYDKRISFMERLLFGDGRAWVCSQASGEVLDVAVGTGRNLPFYPAGVRLTGIDLSPAMLAIARTRADDCGVQIDLREGMHRRYCSRMPPSTPSSARCPSAIFRMTALRWPR